MVALAGVVSMVITAAACPWVIRWLEGRAVIDRPVERSSHTVPTVRGGGLAAVAGASVGAAVAVISTSALVAVVAASAAAFAALGLRDDLRGLAAGSRLLVQVLISAVVAGPLAANITSGPGRLAVAGAAVVWVTAYVNAFNFMDGINGIASIQAGVAGVAWALVGWSIDQPVVVAVGTIVAGSAIGFLPFNFPHARAFLGDVGSYFFGSWLAAAAVVGLGAGLTIEMAVAPLVLFASDAGSTLVRRALAGARITQPHREHAYQRLVIAGYSHTAVSLFVGLVIAAASALGAMTMIGSVAVRFVADGALAALMLLYLLAPRWYRPRLEPSPAPST